MAPATGPFGSALRDQRLALDLTQEDLAERAGVSVRAIQALESGEHAPQRATLDRLVRALGLDAEQAGPLVLAGQSRPRRKPMCQTSGLSV